MEVHLGLLTRLSSLFKRHMKLYRKKAFLLLAIVDWSIFSLMPLGLWWRSVIASAHIPLSSLSWRNNLLYFFNNFVKISISLFLKKLFFLTFLRNLTFAQVKTTFSFFYINLGFSNLNHPFLLFFLFNIFLISF